ncbi:hypothetical protein XAP412_1040002 [Xanthomonas phaseoli pv. phaseoli]|uniref:Uncharacterized protein n=1 Tax=Xanthomonas campestris pv. phaseoli TaxID=317013 RepID=A0AB38DU62_XANCH|nr:hypothetical protein XAP412_1040002 [Xanthomonas phaseoli pv. phaseoli]SON75883.1 hypothetical protein XAP6984_1090002 [Xanthomonas phaseoli pv. phaseoli]SON77613.1 hypothetical protein XAP7430_1060002 [Xanthomonas phaseoli pv. phaseoli]
MTAVEVETAAGEEEEEAVVVGAVVSQNLFHDQPS